MGLSNAAIADDYQASIVPLLPRRWELYSVEQILTTAPAVRLCLASTGENPQSPLCQPVVRV